MIRIFLAAFVLVATPMAAHGHDHDAHIADHDGLRAIHAWANATESSAVLVYVEIENGSGEDVILVGAETPIATATELVGLQNAGGEIRFVSIPQMPIPADSELVLAPNGLAIRLEGLGEALVEGGHFDMELEFDAVHLDIVVEIESASATRHSHAGHAH